VRVDVTNTGKVAGKEVVQLYVRDIKSSVARPEKELKAFAKVELAPKQTRTLTFTLDREAFWYFDVTRNAWTTEPGDFEILVGTSSRDIRLRETFTLAPAPRASRLHTGLTVQKLLDDPDGRAILSKHIGGFLLMADMSMAKDMTLEQIATNHPTFVSPSLLAKIGDDLAKV
jgi:beta-glucosidase